MKNSLRKALLEKRATYGGWMQIGHPGCAEVMARAGMAWICVDMEHGAIDLAQMTDIFRALDACGCVPVVRVPTNDTIWIRRCIDAGAKGVIVPLVNDAAQAEQAVRAAKYPPRGVRGYGYCRANAHGADFNAYIAEANEEIAVILQIEHRDAIANLDSILAVPDVDGLFIGPLDLSGSYGLTGQLSHPTVAGALAQFRAACAQRGMATGYHVVRPTAETVRAAIAEGYSLIALGLDNVLLADATERALAATRS